MASKMPKRLAETQLTQDNADQYLNEEEDREESGHFSKANQEAISKRTIRTAVRRGAGEGQSASSGGKGLFSGIQLMSSASSSTGPLPFSLTSSLATQKPTSSAFTSFSSQHTSPLQSLAGGAIPTLSFGGGSAEKKEQGPTSSTQMGSGSSGYLYLSNLKSLNTSFLAWVEKHVRENPYVDLTPVFKDYERHIGELDKHNGSAPGEAASQSDSESQVTDSENSQKTDVTQPASQPSEASGSEDGGPKPSSLFTLGSAQVQTASSEGDASAEVDEDAVPVPKKSEPGPGEMRAKLFYKKGEEYVTLGVGLLTVTRKGESAWLLMRSDTVTKKTLLSVLVNSKTPLQITQKSLLFVSPPNPPLDFGKKDPDSPVSYVLRVKTVEEAERLHDSIKEAFS